MVTSPEAIQQFLARVPPELPNFKAMPREELLQTIYNCTGARYKEKTVSKPHQLPGTAFALYRRRSFLFYWMRLGKTKIGLDWLSHLMRARLCQRKGLVIAHSPLGADVWVTQAHTHSDLRTVNVVAGPRALDTLLNALEDDTELIVLSWSVIQSLFSFKQLSRKGAPKLYPNTEALRIVAPFFSACIIDEIHLSGNALSLRFALGKEIVAHCKQRLGLTGTPLGRDPSALWAQSYLIDEGETLGRTFFFFQDVFCAERQVTLRTGASFTVAEFRKELFPAFLSKMQTLYLAYDGSEVPSATVHSNRIELSMTAEQRVQYNAVLERARTAASEGAEAEIEYYFSTLRRIASGYAPLTDDEGERFVSLKSAKLLWLEDQMEVFDPRMQFIIFHEYVHTGTILREFFARKRISHVLLNGRTKDKAGAVAQFQSGKARVLIAHPGTAGTAIDLPQADYICFFESPTSPAVRAQAAARPMGRATDRPLVIDDLVCAPVERRLLDALEEGRDLLRQVLSSKSEKMWEPV